MVLDEYYRSIAARFDDIRLDRAEEIDSTIARVVDQLPPAAPVLEIGAGTGRYARRLCDHGVRVFALDQQPEMLRFAPDPLRRVCARGQALPFASEAFVACLLIMVIHQVHASQRRGVMTEARRVLRPGGTLLVKTSSHADLERRTSVRYFPAGLAINLARYPQIEELVELARRSGFSLVASEAVHSYEIRPSHEVLRAVRWKHNSMLALLSDPDFRAGYAQLEREARSRPRIRVDHYHTLLTFSC